MASVSILRSRTMPGWLPGALMILSGLIGIAGFFGPWVPHRAAGLVVSGLDLAEYVKFLPEVSSGQMRVQRELFYLPLFAASLSASLLAGRCCLPSWLRIILGLVAIPIALAMLPPAWKPSDLRSPEYLLQGMAIALCLAMVPGILLTRRLPTRVALGLLALLGIGAATFPAWGFLRVHPAIVQVYHAPLRLGWGFWLTLLGYLGVAGVSVVTLLDRRASVSDCAGT